MATVKVVETWFPSVSVAVTSVLVPAAAITEAEKTDPVICEFIAPEVK